MFNRKEENGKIVFTGDVEGIAHHHLRHLLKGLAEEVRIRRERTPLKFHLDLQDALGGKN